AQVEEGNLSFQVMVLRRALGAESAAWIETVPKYGYRFSAPVLTQTTGGAAIAPADAAVREVRNPRPWYFIATALAFIAAALGWLLINRSAAPAKAVAPVPVVSLPGSKLAPSFSADGKDVTFVWNGKSGDNWDVYVKVNGVEEPLRITSSSEA